MEEKGMKKETVEVENGCKKNEGEEVLVLREPAGLDFEMEGDMNDELLCIPLPQIYILFGMMVFLCVFYIVLMITDRVYFYFLGYFFWTILVGMCIFLPDILNVWFHWLIQAAYWCIYSVCNIIFFIVGLVHHNEEIDRLERKKPRNYERRIADEKSGFSWFVAYIWITEPLLIGIAFILVRMALHGYRNR